MATFNCFEDVLAWQKARALCKLINYYTQNELFSTDFKLVNQIKGSSGSVMDNIAEGLSKLIAGLINHLKASKIKGDKYK